MYSKSEEKELKKKFWDGFAIYAKPFLKNKGKRSWLLFHTQINGLELKFVTTRNRVGVALEVNCKNEDKRFRVFEALNDYKLLIDAHISGIEWHLIALTPLGKEVSEISVYLNDIDYLDQSQWTRIFEFLCSNMIQLETNYLEIVESLKEELKN